MYIMKKNLIKSICWLIVLFCFQTIIAKNDSDIEKLRKLFIEQAMEPVVNVEKVQTLLNTIHPDGTWAGIDYTDVSRTAFQHSRHLDNMMVLAIAYKKKGSPYKGKKNVKQVIDRALAFWLEHDFICENWWWNQIGTPNTMVSLLLLLDNELSVSKSYKMLEIVGRGNMKASGARPSGDRIKIAGIQAKAALYKRDKAEVELLLKIIEGEIKFSKERGMQHDFSFHHRVDWVNNTLSYGSGYADAFVEWAVSVAGTCYHFSEKSLQLLIDYYLDGICKQMVYGKFPDPGVANRDITRPAGGRVWSTKTPERLLTVTNYRRSELEAIIDLREGNKSIVPSYAKFFWCTDHFVFQRPNFYTSVRMYSTRNANMEMPYNGEGLMNHFRGDGTNYLSLDGDEYKELTPVCDWMKIPGTTIVQLESMPSENDVQKWGLTDFVGAVTDGKYGAVGFNFKSPHTGLAAKKAWFFFDKEYICLGSGITNKMNRPAVTTLNQCLLSGDIWIKDERGIHLQDKGFWKMKDVQWIIHDRVGYVFPKKTSVSLSNQEVKGNWAFANKQTSISKTEIKQDVFSLWLDHGVHSFDANYEYVVIPSIDKSAMVEYMQNCPISILTNTPDLQAVRHDELHIAYAVFYKSGTFHITEGLYVTMDSPGLLMVKYNDVGDILTMAVSDPSHFLGKLHLSVNRKMLDPQQKNIKMKWDNESSTTQITIDLPQNEYAGKSVVYSK